MSNYYFRSQFSFSNSAKPVTLRAKIAIGALGDPVIVANTGMGIASVVRNAAGKFTINLSRPFHDLMSVHLMPIAASASPGSCAAPIMNVMAEQVANSATPKLQIRSNDYTGVATDPAQGEIIMVEIVLNDSSLNY